MKRGEEGIALLLTVVSLLLLCLLGTALVFVSAQELLVAHARTEELRARVGAQSAALAALDGWNAVRYRELEIGESLAAEEGAGALPGGVLFDASVERLAGGTYLLRGRARSGNGRGAEAWAGLVVRAIDPRDVLAVFPAAARFGGPVEVEADTRLVGLADDNGDLPPEACPPDAENAVVAVFGSPDRPALQIPRLADVRLAPGAVLEGDPPLTSDTALADSAAFAGLGPLAWDEVAALADRLEAGTIHPQPAIAIGLCDPTAPANWGDPEDLAGPCGDYLPFIYAPGDLEVAGGTGQGILVVRGNLTLAAGTSFHGPVLAGGAVSLGAGAQIHGALAAASPGASRVDGAHVTYSACTLWRAITSAPALRRPLRAATRQWIPLF